MEGAAPGHLSWWLCDAALQREVLSGLTAAACADGEERCGGWAASGECSKNRSFMMGRCGHRILIRALHPTNPKP